MGLRPSSSGSVKESDAPAISQPSRLSLSRYSMFESFESRDFRWMWMSSLTSFMAMNMQMITRGWLVLRLADDSPLALALVMMSFALPMTFVSLIGGALADRISKRRMIMLSQSGNIALTLVLATLDFTGFVEFWHLLIIGVINGSLMAMNMPSRQAIISEIVPENRLMNAISLNNSGMNLTRIAGPALAGVLIVFIDTSGVLYLISGIYVFAVLSVWMINAGREPATSVHKGVTSDIRDGLSYAAGNPTMLGLIIMAFIPSLFGFSYFALLPAWGREALNVEADDLGFLMMVMGIGALVGTLGLASLKNMKRRGLVLIGSAALWGITLAIFSQATTYALAMPLIMIMGLLSATYMSLSMTLIQIYSAPEMRGRMMSITMMTFGVMPLSAVPFGALAESTGTPDALFVSGGLLLVSTVLFTLAFPKFRKVA